MEMLARRGAVGKDTFPDTGAEILRLARVMGRGRPGLPHSGRLAVIAARGLYLALGGAADSWNTLTHSAERVAAMCRAERLPEETAGACSRWHVLDHVRRGLENRGMSDPRCVSCLVCATEGLAVSELAERRGPCGLAYVVRNHSFAFDIDTALEAICDLVELGPAGTIAAAAIRRLRAVIAELVKREFVEEDVGPRVAELEVALNRLAQHDREAVGRPERVSTSPSSSAQSAESANSTGRGTPVSRCGQTTRFVVEQKELDLSAKGEPSMLSWEGVLLVYLLAHQCEPVTREELLTAFWSAERGERKEPSKELVSSTFASLARKLEDLASKPVLERVGRGKYGWAR